MRLRCRAIAKAFAAFAVLFASAASAQSLLGGWSCETQMESGGAEWLVEFAPTKPQRPMCSDARAMN